MAHAESWGYNVLTVTLDASVTSDWTCTRDIIPTGYYLSNAAAGEYVVIGQGSSLLAPAKLTSISGEEVGLFVHKCSPWPQPYKPVMDWDTSSFAGTVTLTITFV
jgi:hypothetical protein